MISSLVRDSGAKIHRAAHSDASCSHPTVAVEVHGRDAKSKVVVNIDFGSPPRNLSRAAKIQLSVLLVRHSTSQSNGTCFPSSAAPHSTRPQLERKRLDQYRQTPLQRFNSSDEGDAGQT